MVNADVQTRDPRQWPFAANSIWNMPIGTNARLVPAEIKAATDWGFTVDEDIIIMTPDAPLVDVYENNADWSGSDRCVNTGGIIKSVHIPSNFVVKPHPIGSDPNSFSPDYWTGVSPNHATAILLNDGRTIFQTQPFSRCVYGRYATSHYTLAQQGKLDIDICGDGIEGLHGGSGLSSLGGTIRSGELAPGKTINHALKVNINAAENLYYDGIYKGYRWPAIHADYNALNLYHGTIPQLRMGALLALKADFSIESLKTEPAKIIAKAFKQYGGYVVDNTGWKTYALAIEWSPAGRVRDEFIHTPWVVNGIRNQFFDIDMGDKQHPWSEDMRTIFASLYVVDDNSSTNIGGSGIHAPIAPSFSHICINPSVAVKRRSSWKRALFQ